MDANTHRKLLTEPELPRDFDELQRLRNLTEEAIRFFLAEKCEVDGTIGSVDTFKNRDFSDFATSLATTQSLASSSKKPERLDLISRLLAPIEKEVLKQALKASVELWDEVMRRSREELDATPADFWNPLHTALPAEKHAKARRLFIDLAVKNELLHRFKTLSELYDGVCKSLLSLENRLTQAINGHVQQGDQPAKPNVPPKHQPKKRGAKRKSDSNEDRILNAWFNRLSRKTKKDVAADLKLPLKSVHDVIERHRKRKKRADK